MLKSKVSYQKLVKTYAFGLKICHFFKISYNQIIIKIILINYKRIKNSIKFNNKATNYINWS